LKNTPKPLKINSSSRFHEKKFKTLEEKKPNEMEMAEKKTQKRKKKA